MERYEQQFKKGILELVVLKLISEERSYGYDLILKLRKQSDGLLDLKEGTLYPLLYRLEDEGYISAEVDTSQNNKRKIKYYSITGSGKNLLENLLIYWKTFSKCINQTLHMKEGEGNGC